jgi:Tol biopolymer transport system component
LTIAALHACVVARSKRNLGRLVVAAVVVAMGVGFVGMSSGGQARVSSRWGDSSEVFTSGAAPAWSPDGSQIAYVGPYSTSGVGSATHVIVMASDGRGKRVVASAARGSIFGEVRFARGRLVYNVVPDGALRSLDLSTGKAVVLGRADLLPDPEEPFTVSRAGASVAFVSPCMCPPYPVDAIRVVPAAGGRARTLPRPPHANDQWPSFSRDGEKVVFARSIYGRPDRSGAGPSTLMVASSAGGRPRALGVTGDLPAWSPNGKWIAYRRTVTPSGSLHVYSLAVIPATGGAPRLLVGHLADLDSFAWSPDSRKLVFTTNDTIGTIDADRATVTTFKLGSLRPGYSTPQWAPNGKSIAFWAILGHEARIYTSHPDGTKLRRLT